MTLLFITIIKTVTADIAMNAHFGYPPFYPLPPSRLTSPSESLTFLGFLPPRRVCMIP